LNTIPAFAYTTADKAPLYRAIMRAFMQAMERCVFNLRIQDVVDAVPPRLKDLEEIEAAIEQLLVWGNLQTVPDTTSVKTVDDFLKPRQLLQMTRLGEAAERAVSLFEEDSGCEPALQSDALADAQDVVMLRHNCQTLMLTLQTLIRKLEGIRSQPAFDIDEARRLVEDAERFASVLVMASDPIQDSIRRLEAAGLERKQCEYFRDWFVSEPDRPSNAEIGRQRLRELITSVLSAVTRIQGSRIHKVDRADDFRILARSFAAAESDAHAHRLWRSVFGLCPARHLIVDDATLDDLEKRNIPASTSWLEAPPVGITMTSRPGQSHAQAGVFSRVVDRTEEKQKLAIATHEEAMRILAAQSRFSGGRMRLSQLEFLELDEFDLLLDLLGEGVEILSGDGSPRIRLEPTADGETAMILTDGGMFSGPDYWIKFGDDALYADGHE